MSKDEKTILTIKAEKIGEWGVLAGGTWYSISQYGDVELDQFEAGKTYQVKGSYSKNGKFYISEVVGSGDASEESPKAPVVKKATPVVKAATHPPKAVKPAVSTTAENGTKTSYPSVEERSNRDFSQLVGGALHDVSTISAALITTGEKAEEALEKAINLVVSARTSLQEKLK